MRGLALSALAPNPDRATSLVPLIILPEIIFSGTMFQLTGALGTISYIVAARWGLAALGGFLHLHYFIYCAPLPQVPQAIGIPSNDCPPGFIEGFGSQVFYTTISGDLLTAWLALLIFIIVPFVLAVYFQKCKDAHWV